MSIIKTIQQIQTDIRQFSPHPERVKLLAVSKKQSVECIQKLINQGQEHFGENYVQEALEKIDSLPKNIKWHMIGHLQSKKVNSIIGKFAYIHSVDSYKIARLISEKSKEQGIIQNIFIEVNLGNEESKNGFTLAELMQKWSELAELDAVRLCGLMALPPLTGDSQLTRSHFKKLRDLLAELRANLDTRKHPFDELSMGTSQDYQLALEEGSTFIRIGTILFGERL